MLTQGQLTSEFEIAEVNSLRAEAEARRRNVEQELSQEVHMFNQSRALIEEMRMNFSIEDRGCIRRIEMLEAQRNEYAAGLETLGHQAEAAIQNQHVEYTEEIQRIENLAEAHVGNQNGEILRLKQELSNANHEASTRNRQQLEYEREALRRNEHLSSDLLNYKSRIQHHESEATLLKNSMQDRVAIYHSEISNLQSTIANQNRLQLQRSRFTEEETRAYIIHHQEIVYSRR